MQGQSGMNTKTRELALIALLASLALALAWRVEQDYFAIYFATAAAIAIVSTRRFNDRMCSAACMPHSSI
jgi:hypothetical protein